MRDVDRWVDFCRSRNYKSVYMMKEKGGASRTCVASVYADMIQGIKQ